jgi:pimeloyl-ACP methyl ester carboxylesterase
MQVNSLHFYFNDLVLKKHPVAEFIHYKNARLHYHIIGNGAKPLLVFHGFGQDKEVFSDLSEALSNNYRFYIFDLFFHGKSEWNDGEQPLEKEFWKEIINQLIVTNNIKTFSVLGFSMGGKFALTTLEMFPLQVKEIFLLAPDGIKTSTWYSLATYPVALRGIFKSMILKPKRFNLITSFCYKLGLVDKGIIRFAESQMNTEEKRKQVYYSWVVFRHLKFSMSKMAAIINSNNISTTIVVGKFDKIITAKNMNKLAGKLQTCKVEVLETGHNGLIRKWAESIKTKMITNTEGYR